MKVKQVLLAAIAIGGIPFAGSAMAQGVDVAVGVGIPLSPGFNGASPGQLFNAARIQDPSTALPPGKAFIQDGKTTAPGLGFTNYGRSKK